MGKKHREREWERLRWGSNGERGRERLSEQKERERETKRDSGRETEMRE